MVEGCLCSPCKLVISFQSPSHPYLLSPWKNPVTVHQPKWRSITSYLYTFSTCVTHGELHTEAGGSASCTGMRASRIFWDKNSTLHPSSTVSGTQKAHTVALFLPISPFSASLQVFSKGTLYCAQSPELLLFCMWPELISSGEGAAWRASHPQLGRKELQPFFLHSVPSGKGMTLTAVLDFPERFMTQFKVMGLLLIIINTNFITLQLPKKLHTMEGK